MTLPLIINNKPLTPDQVRYDDKGIWLADEYTECVNPRLEFAKVLSTFEHTSSYASPFESVRIETSTVIGKDVRCGKFCVIGGAGFGYEYDESGALIPMPHLGNVIIGDNVTLHNNVCIDRAVTGSTVIGEGTKIDNLVHVAHGVHIGKHCLIVSGVVLGGRCDIGDYCFIGMNACIKQHVKIGRNCVIGAGAVVTKDIPDNQIWVGNPAKYLKGVEPRNYKV